jgi:hypothetical protein
MKLPQMKHMDKKGQAEAIVQVIVALGIGVIVIAVIAIMLGAFQSDLTVNSAEYNVTGRGLTFLDNATDKFSTAGTIVGVLFLLGILGGGAFMGYAAYKKAR